MYELLQNEWVVNIGAAIISGIILELLFTVFSRKKEEKNIKSINVISKECINLMASDNCLQQNVDGQKTEQGVIRYLIKFIYRALIMAIVLFGILLIVLVLRGNQSRDNSVETIDWNIIFMNRNIPEPKSKMIQIHTNKDDELWIDICSTTEAEYYEYIYKCKNLGYIVSVNDTIGYDAYNAEGYHLEIGFYSSKQEMSIKLTSPLDISELVWKEHEISAILPEPETSVGIFLIENSETNKIVLSGNDELAFSNYCEACKKVGFVIDTKEEKESYSAFDENGNKIEISYNSRNKEITITFEYPMCFSEFSWPKVGVGKLAPEPTSLSGKIVNDYGWVYSVYVENTTREEFEEYFQECIDVGFDKEVKKYGDSVWANYSDEIYIHVEYIGFEIMYITVTGAMNENY